MVQMRRRSNYLEKAQAEITKNGIAFIIANNAGTVQHATVINKLNE